MNRQQKSFFSTDTSLSGKIIGIVIILGVVTSIMSGLETKVAWISSFCSAFGDGCRETVPYRMMGIPIPFWGVGYYTMLALLYLIRPSWLFFPVMAGCGMEAVLVVIMTKMKFVCVLCGINLMWMLILFLLLFDRKRIALMLCLGLACYIASDALIQSPWAALPENPAVLARVGDRDITRKEVEQPITTRLYKSRMQIYQMKQAILESRVDDILLEKDASKKGITVQALRDELSSGTPTPDSRIVDSYFNTGRYKRWGQWAGTEQEIKEKIRQHLAMAEQSQQILDHCQKLRQEYPVSIFLEKPSLPLTHVAIDGCPTTGPAQAPVIVIELSDYLCPACRKGHDVVEQIRKKYKDNVRWVFKANPLERIHPGAGAMALAARCAMDQGQFWAFHDRLFSGKKPDFKDALDYARLLDLDIARFTECAADPQGLEKLKQETQAVRRAGITSTPTLIINGELHVGIPSVEELSRLIDQALTDAGVVGAP